MTRQLGRPSLVVVVRCWIVLLPLLMGETWRAEGYHTFSCEGGMITLECRPGSQLLIHNAFFGKKQGTLNRCGETQRATQSCEHDITKFMKHSCDGKLFCQAPVELSAFKLDTFCPDYIKYAEVHFDCVLPSTVSRVQACVSRCMPPPRPAPIHPVGMQGAKPHQHVASSGGNSVLPLSSAQPTPHHPQPPAMSPKAFGAGPGGAPSAISNADHFSSIAATINSLKARMNAARPSARAQATNPQERLRMLARLARLMWATKHGRRQG